MRLMRERDQARRVAKDWQDTYGHDGHYRDAKEEIGRALSKMDPETVTAKEIAAIIGNDSWCAPIVCQECGEETWDIVELGEILGHDSATAYVCLDCLRKVVRLLEHPAEGAKE